MSKNTLISLSSTDLIAIIRGSRLLEQLSLRLPLALSLLRLRPILSRKCLDELLRLTRLCGFRGLLERLRVASTREINTS